MPNIPRHLWVTASAWGSRGVVALSQLFVIRLVTQTRGTQNYAAFAILYGLATWFLAADFGLGYSIQNEISERRAKGRPYGTIVRKVLGALLILLTAELCVIAACAAWTGGQLLRQFQQFDANQKAALFLTAAVLLLLAGAGQVAYRIWYAEQKGYWSNVLPALGQALGVASVLALLHRRPTAELTAVLGAYLAPTAFIACVSLGTVFFGSAPENTSRADAKPVFKRSISFGAFGLASLFVLQIDLPIISQFLHPSEIASYAVLSRVFAFVFMIYASALYALWPVCSEHLALNQWESVRRYIRRYMTAGVVVVLLLTAALTVEIERVASILAPGAQLRITKEEIATFGVLYLIRVWTDTYAMALQSKTNMKALWIATPVQALLSIGLELLLVPRMGLLGVAAALICSYALTTAWILPAAFRADRRKSLGLIREERYGDKAVGLYSNI